MDMHQNMNDFIFRNLVTLAISAANLYRKSSVIGGYIY